MLAGCLAPRIGWTNHTTGELTLALQPQNPPLQPTMSSKSRRRAAQAASMGRLPHRNLERNESSERQAEAWWARGVCVGASRC